MVTAADGISRRMPVSDVIKPDESKEITLPELADTKNDPRFRVKIDIFAKGYPRPYTVHRGGGF